MRTSKIIVAEEKETKEFMEPYIKRKQEFDKTYLSKSVNFTQFPPTKSEVYHNIAKNFAPSKPFLNEFVKTKIKNFQDDVLKRDEKEKKRLIL